MATTVMKAIDRFRFGGWDICILEAKAGEAAQKSIAEISESLKATGNNYGDQWHLLSFSNYHVHITKESDRFPKLASCKKDRLIQM